jgi:hypothetical protein
MLISACASAIVSVSVNASGSGSASASASTTPSPLEFLLRRTLGGSVGSPKGEGHFGDSK